MDDDVLDYGEDPCACHSPDASYRQFTTLAAGVDETDGRHADVEILQCVDCGQLWLRYHVEYEASRNLAVGRAARSRRRKPVR